MGSTSKLVAPIPSNPVFARGSHISTICCAYLDLTSIYSKFWHESAAPHEEIQQISPDLFVKLAEQDRPAVVNISTTQVIKRRRVFRKFAPNNDLFRRFFGDDFFEKFFGEGILEFLFLSFSIRCKVMILLS